MRNIDLLTAVGLAALPAACHTTAGVGKDLSTAGGALRKSANEHPY